MSKKILFVAFLAFGSLVISCTKDSVAPGPTITAYTPNNGVSTGTVVITGMNFSPTAANNIVKFNGTTADIVSSTSTNLTVTIPANATSGPISVTVGDHTFTTPDAFRVDLLFKAVMLGSNEVAPNNTSTGTGTTLLTYNKDARIFSLVVTYTGLTGPGTNAHIHKGVPGVVGAVVFPFASPYTSPINYTSAAITTDQETDLLAGNYYVNVHTSQFPVGEIRGFLVKQ